MPEKADFAPNISETTNPIKACAEHMQRASQNGLKAFQQDRLAALWERARAGTYYRDIGAFSPDAFSSLPVTPKKDLKEYAFEMLACSPDQALKYYESSGTTGSRTPTFRTAEDIVWNYASIYTQWSKIVSESDRVLILLPSDVSPIGDMIAGVTEAIGCCTMRCFPFAQGIVSWDRIAELPQRLKPTVIWASPGTLMQMSRMLIKRGVFQEMADTVEKIFMLGEVVSTALRTRIEEDWGVTAYNGSYGSTETGTIAAANADGVLKVMEHSFLCELLEDDQLLPLAPGLEGEMVVTCLNNYSRPLLRYCTGDRVRAVELEDGIGIEIYGRLSESTTLGGRRLQAEEIEAIVYAQAGVTGYAIKEVTDGSNILLLEAAPDRAADGDELAQAAQKRLQEAGLWVRVQTMAELPLFTKAGAGMKNWKRSNVIRA